MKPSELTAYNMKRLADMEGGYNALARRLGVGSPTVIRWCDGNGAKRLDAIALRLREAGIDPRELLRAPGSDLADPALLEVNRLWSWADPQTRNTILHLLRMVAANAKKAASGDK